MKINRLQSYALGLAAALIAIPGYTALQAQTSPQPTTLYSANAQLTHPLKSSARMGQPVAAKLTTNVQAGSIELPSGTMLTGTVGQTDNANGTTTMSVVFNRAVLKSGRIIGIKATILGAYPPPVYSSDDSMNAMGEYMPSQPRTIPSDYTVTQEAGTLSDVSLNSAAKSDVSGVFASKNHSFKLDSGTRLQVAIAPEGSAASSMDKGN